MSILNKNNGIFNFSLVWTQRLVFMSKETKNDWSSTSDIPKILSKILVATEGIADQSIKWKIEKLIAKLENTDMNWEKEAIKEVLNQVTANLDKLDPEKKREITLIVKEAQKEVKERPSAQPSAEITVWQKQTKDSIKTTLDWNQKSRSVQPERRKEKRIPFVVEKKSYNYAELIQVLKKTEKDPVKYKEIKANLENLKAENVRNVKMRNLHTEISDLKRKVAELNKAVQKNDRALKREILVQSKNPQLQNLVTKSEIEEGVEILMKSYEASIRQKEKDFNDIGQKPVEFFYDKKYVQELSNNLKKEIQDLDRAFWSGEIVKKYWHLNEEKSGYSKFNFQNPAKWVETEILKREESIKKLEKNISNNIEESPSEILPINQQVVWSMPLPANEETPVEEISREVSVESNDQKASNDWKPWNDDNRVPDTEVQAVPSAERLSIKEKFKKISEDPNQDAVTRKLLENEDFYPQELIEIDWYKFYMGKVWANPNWWYCESVMFVEKDGKIYPRLLYKSNSDGGWRSCPWRYDDNDQNDGLYIKWLHYTQSTKPHQQIIDYFEKNSKKERINWDMNSETFFWKNYLWRLWIFSFAQETKNYQSKDSLMQQIAEFQPWQCFYSEFNKSFDREKFVETYSNLPVEFMPDFSKKPKTTYQVSHTLITPYLKEKNYNEDESKITVEVYEWQLDDRKVDWHMAYDAEGRIWIERIVFTDGKVNSYGIQSETIDSGSLTNKPLEYNDQANLLDPIDKRTFNSSWKYADITPILNEMMPIKEFRKAKKIVYQDPNSQHSNQDIDKALDEPLNSSDSDQWADNDTSSSQVSPDDESSTTFTFSQDDIDQLIQIELEDDSEELGEELKAEESEQMNTMAEITPKFSQEGLANTEIHKKMKLRRGIWLLEEDLKRYQALLQKWSKLYSVTELKGKIKKIEESIKQASKKEDTEEEKKDNEEEWKKTIRWKIKSIFKFKKS